MRRLLLVANPSASGFTASLHRDVTEILETGYHVTAVWPNGPAQARTEAAAAAGDGFEVVAAMGGDGVAHEVANGVVGTTTALGIIPAGTTNVLRRIVGLPRKPRAAAEWLAGATGTRPLRTLAISEGTAGSTRSHVATFAAGIGFDGEVIRESERRPFSKVGLGAFHYARSTTKVAMRYRQQQPLLTVTDGRRTSSAVAVQLQIHDHFTYLGRIPLSLGSGPKPLAAVIGRVTPGRLLDIVARSSLRREVARAPDIDVWEAFDEVRVTADRPTWVEADGELLGRATTLTVRPEGRTLLVADA